MQPDLREPLLDALEQALEPLDLQVGMETALHEHAGAAHLDGFGDLGVNSFEVEDVAFAGQLALERTVEGAEGTVLGAEIRVVDIAIDDVGDNAFRMQPAAYSIRFHAESDEVVGVEVFEGLL